MQTTTQFLKAEPERKELMLNDGLAFVAGEMEKLERNARVLTRWMATYPADTELDYATLNDPMKLIQAIHELRRRMDDLTAQLVNASMAYDGLLRFSKDHITKKQLQP